MKRYWSKDSGNIYFITNTICEWKNIFIFKPYIKLIIQSWKHFQKNRAIEFFGFCIMPSHLHYIVYPADENYSIIEMQRDFKKYTAKRILEGLQYEINNGGFPVEDTFKKKHIHRESAEDIINLFRMIGKYSRQKHKVWMSDEKPEVVRSDKFFKQKLKYIHMNPVRANLTDEIVKYPFSSARNYFLNDNYLFEITKPLML